MSIQFDPVLLNVTLNVMGRVNGCLQGGETHCGSYSTDTDQISDCSLSRTMKRRSGLQ